MAENVIESCNLTKKFGKHIAVDSLNIQIEKGKIYGLLGRNGAGKTTMMCMLLNLVKKTDGKIFMLNKDVEKHGNKIYPHVGSIIETPGFYGNLTGVENLKLFSKIQDVPYNNSIHDALKIVSLLDEKDKLFKNYSLGMKQRLGIALALIKSPDILILDEPINGLDPIGILEIRNLLKKLSQKYGLTILISSHILSEMEQIADIIGIMDEGKLIKEITIEELHNTINRHVHFEVSDVNQAIDILKDSDLNENIDFDFDNQGNINLYNNLDLRSSLNQKFVQSGIVVNAMAIVEENLEEYFTNLVSTS